MQLINNDTELNISIIGYQFPDEIGVPEDSDWLMVSLSLKLPVLAWEITDPSLTVAELTWLRDWLSEGFRNAPLFADWQAPKNPLSTRIFFTEPNLSFKLLSNRDAQRPFIFRIYMAAESLPPFAAQLPHSPFDDKPSEAWLDFRASGDDLFRMAAELSDDLRRYLSRSPVH